ncbi:hypothetical protein MU582_09090 [Nocardioidaceae bacterium SCSIO 66511]|nr:hypothetical protein MU582_09090 [Nocardioidaceae bacterium SCSIO 66511]
MVTSRRRTETYADSDFDAVIPAETARVRELYADGVVRQIWLRDDVPGACFIVEADALSDARKIVDGLPMAASGLSEFTVTGLRPYGGFVS